MKVPFRFFISATVGFTALAFSNSIQAQQAAESRIVVTAEPVSTPHPHDDTRPKLEHIMREVSETQVTVTKKATRHQSGQGAADPGQ